MWYDPAIPGREVARRYRRLGLVILYRLAHNGVNTELIRHSAIIPAGSRIVSESLYCILLKGIIRLVVVSLQRNSKDDRTCPSLQHIRILIMRCVCFLVPPCGWKVYDRYRPDVF